MPELLRITSFKAPTEEDRQWFPDLAGTPWLPALDHAMRNFKDESFIGQYLSPKLMRDFRLFAIVDDERESELEVSAIHDESGYRAVGEALAHQYDLGSREPNIQVWSVNLRGDRSLTLRHTQHNNRPLHEGAHVVRAVGEHIAEGARGQQADVLQVGHLPGCERREFAEALVKAVTDQIMSRGK